MDLIEWNTVFTDVLTGVILLGAGGIVGYFTGKKKSSLAIERKRELYQPLLEELDLLCNFLKKEQIKKIELPLLNESVVNEYKYGFRRKLKEKCNKLNSLLIQYNNINLISVAQNIIVDIFEESYDELFGSKIDGVSFQSDRYGNSWEVEHIAEPIELIRKANFEKSITLLLQSEGMFDREVCVDSQNEIFEPIYGELVSIFNSALNININGVNFKLPPLKKDIDISPAEYMALNDFFNRFNADIQTIKKNKLRKEIIENTHQIIKELKEIIRKIVDIYEVEEI